MRCCDQGAHIRERLMANRSDLTLQGGPNQHGTQKPRRTPRTNISPPRLELQEPAQRHMVSRAQRETTKSKHMHPQFSATTRLAPRVGCGLLYFRNQAALGLPVSTTSYSWYAVSTVQSPISTADNGRSFIDTDGAKTPRNPVLLPYLYIITIPIRSSISISTSISHVLNINKS